MVDGNVYPQDTEILQSRTRGGGVRGSNVYLEEFDRTIIIAHRDSRLNAADVSFRQAK